MRESTEAESVSETRRDFCWRALKRTTLAMAATAGAVLYEKPAIKSFFGTGDAYAATTGPGKFSLKGDSN